MTNTILQTKTLETQSLILCAARQIDPADFRHVQQCGRHEILVLIWYLIAVLPEAYPFWDRSSAAYTEVLQIRGYLDSIIGSLTNGVLDFIIEVAPLYAPSPDGKISGKVGISYSNKSEIGFMLNHE